MNTGARADSAAILLFPTPLPAKLVGSPLFPILSNAAKELASDNIKTAVMLTGVMLLQVSLQQG